MATPSLIPLVLITTMTAGGPALESTPMLIDDFSRSDGCFPAGACWRTVVLPFADFRGYRLGDPLDTRRLLRLGLVAGGGEFPADLRVRRIELVGNEGHE